MGHIVARKRGDRTTGFTAQIVKKKKGDPTYREAKTFDRRQAAAAWLERRENELAQPGALERVADPKFRDAIARLIDETEGEIGDTKAQVLRSFQNSELGELRCGNVTSDAIVRYIRSLKVEPSTRSNYLSHISPVFDIARPAWGYPLSRQQLDDAVVVLKRLKLIGKSKARDRRPTIEELDQLMAHFALVQEARPRSIPMTKIIPFALFSTRRQDEITRILRSDYQPARDGERARVLVRDMKHPGNKKGNDTWCQLPEEAAAYLKSMPAVDDRVFPFDPGTISAAFTRACLFLGINTKEMPDEQRLHFHDLRHEGISRLFEIDSRDIPRNTEVSGHKSWASVQRYTHIRQSGDKYANWKWRKP